jgi:hypothetical protein
MAARFMSTRPSNHLSAQNLADWNMHKVAGPAISAGHAAEIANRVLVQRLDTIHRHLPQDQPLRLGLFVRRPPPFQHGTALALDWSARFAEKEAAPEIWQETLLPALGRIVKAIREHAPGREVEAFGLPTLPAAKSRSRTIMVAETALN